MTKYTEILKLKKMLGKTKPFNCCKICKFAEIPKIEHHPKTVFCSLFDELHWEIWVCEKFELNS